jgi:hypothetical protein
MGSRGGKKFGSGMEKLKIQIRDGKNFGSGRNIPDSQHRRHEKSVSLVK